MSIIFSSSKENLFQLSRNFVNQASPKESKGKEKIKVKQTEKSDLGGNCGTPQNEEEL